MPVLFASFTDNETAEMIGLALLTLSLAFTLFFYRRMVRKAQHSELQLRRLLEAAPFAIGVTRRSTGEFLFANRHAIRLLALDPETYRGQSVPYVDREKGRARMLAEFENHGRVQDMEMEFVAYDGRRFPVLGSVAPCDFGREEALIGTFQDISIQKEAELKVRASEARLRALFQTVPDGIVVLDTNGIVKQVSETCAELVGDTNLAHHLGAQILDYVAANDRPIAAELLHKLVAGQPREIVPYRIRHNDGTEVWVEPKGVVIVDPVTQERMVILVLRNITKRRQAEEQLAAHAAELQEALARITHLQNEFLRVCAWTKQVNIDGQWMPIDHYLAKHLGFKLSHGISEEGLAILGAPPEQPEPPKTKEADRNPPSSKL